MIQLKKTATEYLLWVPYAQKERAKSIQGYRWDGARKCWVFPHTRRVYEALIAEFGGDLGDDGLFPPREESERSQAPSVATLAPIPEVGHQPPVGGSVATPPPPESPLAANDGLFAAIQGENDILRSELAKIQDALKSINKATPSGQDGQLANLKKALAEREQELAKVNKDRMDLRAKNRTLEAKLIAKDKELDQLKVKLRRQESEGQLESMLRELAIAVANDHGKFTQMISSTSISTELPLALGRHLETALRVMNKNPDRSDTLHDLITFTREAQRLTPEGIDMAHLIRKQRNIVAHSKADPHTIPARAVLCLFAAAILWPEFPDN